jgi:hypothetical protein
MAKTPTWQRKAGKNPNGGLNEAGRRSLKAAGHDIKRPQPEGGSRRDSFCRRMKGMKAKNTSSETANDPDSRINKSLRAWNCADGGAIRPELGGGGDALKAAMKVAQDAIRAYHGSRHKFDKFDINKLGTGVGGNLRGNGLYFSAEEPIAREYRDGMSQMVIGVDGRPLPEGVDPVVKAAARSGNSVESFMDSLRQQRDKLIEKGFAIDPKNPDLELDRMLHELQVDELGKKINALEPYAGKKFGNVSTGHMYEVDINTSPEKLLDWDKPYHQQSEHVRNVLDELKVPVMMRDPFGERKEIPTPGFLAYSHLGKRPDAERFGATKASDTLKEAGIPGITYSDDLTNVMSKPAAASNNPQNYVMFDPSLIDILRRYAQGGEVRPEMGAGGDAVKAAMKVAQDALLALHGMKSHRLDMTEKLKGLPVPSIAITKPEQGYNRFGDITLVGGKEMATPSRLNPVYGADVYSPRFPSLNEEGDKIFKGFTSLGNRRYSPLTMQNVVKEMAGNIRGGEGFNYGAGNIRAAVTPQFKTLKDVQNARDSIVSSEEFKPHKKVAEDYLFELADKFHPYSLYSGSPFQHTQSFAETLSDVGKGRHSAWSQDYKDIPDELKQEAMDYLSRLKNMPTEYFEAKPQRAVSLGEFAGAVVPENLMRETVPRLKNLGIKEIVPFNPDMETGQIEALREFSNLHFNQGGEVRPEMGAGGSGVKAAVKMAQDIIKAYHGSPHKFDKFDIGKIGTGEGAQAYGHGLYFADKEGVARSYRDALSAKAATIGGKPVTDLAAQKYRLGIMESPTPEQDIADYISSYQDNARYMMEKRAPHLVPIYDELKSTGSLNNKGHMYEVGIRANPEHLLDWDKPIANQPNIVRGLNQYVDEMGGEQSLRQYSKRLEDKRRAEEESFARLWDSDQPTDLSDMMTYFNKNKYSSKEALADLLSNINKGGEAKGEDFYRSLAPQEYDYKGATETASRLGIPGIKYLDRMSRGAGEGSSNYVVFDPKIIDIMRRYADGGRIHFDEGGLARIEELLRQAKGEEQATQASHPVGMSGNVEFAPVEIDEPITGSKIPLGSLPAPTAAVVNPVANILAQYGPYAMGPIPAGMAAARDLVTGLKEGSGLNVATAAMGAPGKALKYGLPALGAVTDLLSPTEAQAGPYTKFLKELAEKYRPHYDPSAMIKGQPKDKWISDVALSRPIEQMSVKTTDQRNMIPEARIQPIEMAGKAMISGFGDKTPAGYVVTHLNDRKLSSPVNVLGGPAFARDQAAQIDEAYWGSNRSRASALANKGKEAVEKKYDPVFAYITQGPQSQDFSHQMTEMILGQLKKKDMDKKLVEQFDQLMREKEIKKGMPGIPTWPGLTSPKLKQWLMESREGGAGRAKMAKLMDKSMYLKAPGFADVGAARFATTHPDIMNTPIFSSGHMFSRMDPEGRLITNPKVPHPSYDTLLASPKGKQGYIGGFEYELPPELHFHDYLSGAESGYQSGIRPDLVEKPFTQKTMSLMRETPTVIGTPKWVDMASEYQDIMRYLYGRRP